MGTSNSSLQQPQSIFYPKIFHEVSGIISWLLRCFSEGIWCTSVFIGEDRERMHYMVHCFQDKSCPISTMAISRLKLLSVLLVAWFLPSIALVIWQEQVLDKPMCVTDTNIALHGPRVWKKFMVSLPRPTQSTSMPSREIKLLLLNNNTLWLMEPTVEPPISVTLYLTPLFLGPDLVPKRLA